MVGADFFKLRDDTDIIIAVLNLCKIRFDFGPFLRTQRHRGNVHDLVVGRNCRIHVLKSVVRFQSDRTQE